MHFLRKGLNSKHKKLNTNDSVVNNWQKLDLLKPIFNKKYSIFTLIFHLYKYFANKYTKNAQFNLFYQYMPLFTKVKQFSKLLKTKKK